MDGSYQYQYGSRIKFVNFAWTILLVFARMTRTTPFVAASLASALFYAADGKWRGVIPTRVFRLRPSLPDYIYFIDLRADTARHSALIPHSRTFPQFPHSHYGAAFSAGPDLFGRTPSLSSGGRFGAASASSATYAASESPASSADAAGSNSGALNPMVAGSTCALITPFTPAGAVDVPTLRSLLRLHVEAGTDGLCVLGTTAEAAVLTPEERDLVLETVVQEVKGRIPILVGTGTIDPSHVREMTLRAADAGADASLVVTPYYVKPPQRCLARHMLDAADLGLPVIMYNVPGRTGSDMLPETIALCADHEYIIGVKEATGDISRVGAIRELTGVGSSPLLLLSGDDGTDADFVLAGGDGCISVTANIAPRQKHELMHAALRRDGDKVKQIGRPMEDLNGKLFCEANPIPAKWAAMRMGLIPSAYCRPPLDELDPECYGAVEKALNAAGLI